jgi:hypothetical protein
MALVSPATSAVAVPSRTSALGAGYRSLYEGNAGACRAPSQPGNFVRSAGRCADHDWPRSACGVLNLAEQRFNLFSTIDCNNNRSGSAGEFAHRRCDHAATCLQLLAPGGFDIEADQWHISADQAFGQRGAHQPQSDDSDRRIRLHDQIATFYIATISLRCRRLWHPQSIA